MAVILEGAGLSHDLSIVRASSTSSIDFRSAVHRIGLHLAAEVSKHLPTVEVDVQTPLAIAPCKSVRGGVILIPVLRAGLGLLNAFMEFLPMSEVGFAGMRRNEDDLQPTQYYRRFPASDADTTFIIVDPMLATGGSLSATVELLADMPRASIMAACLIASSQGIAAFESQHPDVRLFCAAVDPSLNDQGFIVPGLGDAGDRLFGE